MHKIKKLTTKKDEYIELTNDLTREMDKYSKYIGRAKTYIYVTYIFGSTKFFSIRYAGATRGAIIVDKNMVIKNITLLESMKGIYKDEISECFTKYIGMKLVII